MDKLEFIEKEKGYYEELTFQDKAKKTDKH